MEFAEFLRSFGFEARRGQQFQGTPDSPDIIDNTGYHIEVKRTEALSVYKAMEQAESDCGDKVPIVAHRRSRKPWLIIIKADDFFKSATNLITG